MRPNYTLPRLYFADEIKGDINLSREQSHYLSTVLRRAEGDEVRLFNAEDGEWAAQVISAGRKSVTLQTLRQLRAPQSVPDIRLVFAPIRKHRVAILIEKATELGARTLQPVITARTQFPKLNVDRAAAQIIEAAEQTERLDLPSFDAPLSFQDYVASIGSNPARTVLFADEAGSAEPAAALIRTVNVPLDILIGPEGGFTPEEREVLRAVDHVKPVTLGPRILRADTAAISALTLVQAIRGDWNHASAQQK